MRSVAFTQELGVAWMERSRGKREGIKGKKVERKEMINRISFPACYMV